MTNFITEQLPDVSSKQPAASDQRPVIDRILKRLFSTLLLSLSCYFSFGQLKETQTEVYDFKKDKSVSIYTETYYDKHGDATGAIQKMRDDEGDLITTTSTYTFDEQGRRSKVVMRTENKKVTPYRHVIEYSYKDNTVEERNGKAKTIKYYDHSKRIVKEEHFDHDNLTSLSDYTYDSLGRLVMRHKEPKNNNEDYVMHTYTYLDSARRHEHIERTSFGSEKVVTDIISDLNNAGKPVKTKHVTDKSTEVFTYDEIGNLTEARTMDANDKLI